LSSGVIHYRVFMRSVEGSLVNVPSCPFVLIIFFKGQDITLAQFWYNHFCL
jgi:hypothetical protein